MSSVPSPQTVAFLGASGGCGLAALQHTLAAGHTCVALCRTPSKLAAAFPDPQALPRGLNLVRGDAHDAASVAECLRVPGSAAPGILVDIVVFTIGSPFNLAKMTTLDPDVCKKGIAALLEALASLRRAGARPAGGAGTGPRLVVISTCGISAAGRDFPLAATPMYSFMLKVPHADKRVMEERLLAGGEAYTLVRPSLLCDGARPDRKIRVGVVDARSGEGPTAKDGVGYSISREDTGRWMAENLILKPATEYIGKAVLITW